MDEEKLEKEILQYKELMTAQEVANYLSLSVGAIRKRVTNRSIPFERLSPKCVRFRRSSIDEWLKKGGQA